MITRRAIAALAVLTAFLAPGSQAVAQTPEPPPEPPTVAPPAEPGGDVVHRWAIAPAGSDDPSEPSNRTTFAYTAAPGAVINDAVTIYNLGNVELDFDVYATDATNSDDGTLGLLSGDEEPTEVGAWTTLGVDEVSLPAGEQATFQMQIVVPDDARPGDHLGAVIASSSTGGGEGRVGLDRRTAAMIRMRVDGPVVTELAVTDLSTEYDNAVNPFGGTMSVSYRIENRGDVALGGTSNVTVTGPFGIGGQSLPPFEFATLLPGQDITVTADVDGLVSAGLLTTSVEVVPEASGDDAALGPVSASTRTFAPPIALLLVLAAVLFGVLTVRAVRRHRQRQVDETTVVAPEREPQLT